MGQTYGVRCKECGYSKAVKEGIGYMYEPNRIFCSSGQEKPMVESLVKSATVKKKAYDMVNQGAMLGVYGYAIYCCPGCHEIYTRFHFHLRSEEGHEFEPEYKCNDCKRKLMRVQMEGEQGILHMRKADGTKFQWNCPDCGSEKLELDEEKGLSHWD